jgi:bifunctional UDP-N-acetylglucosamine pyrophosphorylase / glucosamine-1-phosphate N-acetyltransferase
LERVVVIPAAGSGSRLGATLPKLLVRVNGRPMVEYLFDLYAPHADRMMVVVSPAAIDAMSELVSRRTPPVSVLVQQQPTGMLDAVLQARDSVSAARPRRVLITWCDQIAMLPSTIDAVVDAAAVTPEPALVLPTCRSDTPYVHLQRDSTGSIVRVLHRREDDDMPQTGESDAGVFDLSFQAYMEWLPEYAEAPSVGARTGERNFVPFVAWAGRRGRVVTVPCEDQEEAIGINTSTDLARLEAYLRMRHRQ